MSQASPTIGANKSGLAYRQEDNDGKKALLTHHKAATAPTYSEAGLIWLDDASTPWLLKMHDGADWITLGEINAATNTFQPYAGLGTAKWLNYASDTGTANAYAIAPVPAITAYAAGQMIILKPGAGNTSASTLAVNGLAAQDIRTQNGGSLSAGLINANGVYLLVYNGAQFVLTNPNPVSRLLTARGTVVPSAEILNIGNADSDFVEVSGTETIHALGTGGAYHHVWVKFQNSLLLAYDSIAFILPGGGSLTTAPGDLAEFVRLSGGSWQCLSYHRANGKPVAPFSAQDLPNGTVVDRAYNQYTANADLVSNIPYDDTIPQITEGTEFMSASITPKSVTNRLRVTVSTLGSTDGVGVSGCVALFRDGGPGAIAANYGHIPSAGQTRSWNFVYEFAAGSTNPTTLKVRAGGGGGTMRMNGYVGARLFGGVLLCSIVIEEIKA